MRTGGRSHRRPEGSRDFHYGNNIQLPAGQYHVTAAAGGQTGAFDIKV